MPQARILLINDSREVSDSLKDKLGEGNYSFFVEKSWREGLKYLKEGEVDVVILNTGTLGAGLSEAIKEFKKLDSDIFIIVLMEKEDYGLLDELSQLNVYDFIIRPFNENKVFFLLNKGMQLHNLAVAHRKLTEGLKENNLALQKQNAFLAKRVEESAKNLSRLYEDLRSTYMRTIKALAQAIDARDHYTHSHSQNVAKYAVAIAEEMHLPAKDIEIIREACELHDLGKIGIQDDILVKPSELNPQEWELMKKHPLTAAQILEPLTFLHGVVDLIRQHHEHYDGSGYPQGLKGDKILLGARIIHLADAYEAMTSRRSYRKEPFLKEEAVFEIKRNSGKQFDPKVVEVFLKVVDRF